MTEIVPIKNLLALFCLFAGLQTSVAQAGFWSETFGSQNAFNAWTTGSTGAGAEVWNWSTDAANAMGFNAPPATFNAPSANSGFAFFNSDANGDGNIHDVTLTSGAISCASHTSVGIRFHSQFADFQGSTAQVRVSTNGGASWTSYDIFDDQPSYSFNQEGLVPADILTEMALPAANGQAMVWIQFRWEGNYEYGWKLDDIQLYDYVAPQVQVTFRVNMALQTIDPAGAKLAGSFNGWSNESMTNIGNNIWSLTKTLNAGTAYQYKFKNGPGGWEQAPAACGVDDGNGGFNRSITPTEDATLTTVCFGSCSPCILPCNLNPDALICDNFDSYNTALKLGPQAPWWTTWSGTEGGAEDGIVTIEQANTPTKSFKIISTAAMGGPQDVMLNLGNKTTGIYELKWKMFIPVGRNGYYNIQNVMPIATGDWNLDVYFENASAGRVLIGNGPTLTTFTYPNGQWFEVKHKIDLDNNLLTLWINGNFVYKMPYAKNLGGIDFYGANNINTYYIDDVEYIKLPPVVYNVDVCDVAVDLYSYFGAPPGLPQTTGLYDNTNATTSATDPEVTCWTETPAEDFVDKSMWYTFIGDGNEYHIETVPCNATNYINFGSPGDEGDTQMLIYAGDNCDDLTEVACNDDLNPAGSPDWRAGLDFQTVKGENYFMLIDGYNLQGTVATGQFCIEITRVPTVPCTAAAVGSYTIPHPYLCFNGQLSGLIKIDTASFILPDVGAVNGMAWAFTTAPLPPDTWPSTATGYVARTPFLTTQFTPPYVNNGGIAYNLYYVTPVVLGGGALINPALQPNPFVFENIDVANACFFVGNSVPIYILPALANISATVVAGNGSADLTPGGGMGAILSDDSFYRYAWSNGATTQDISGVATGTYTCTVTDVSGCALQRIVTVQITTVGTTDPAAVQLFSVSPNPTSGNLNINLTLAALADVRLEVLNILGQTLLSQNIGKVESLSHPLELGNLAQGTYLLRVTIDGESAIRRIVLQR